MKRKSFIRRLWCELFHGKHHEEFPGVIGSPFTYVRCNRCKHRFWFHEAFRV